MPPAGDPPATPPRTPNPGDGKSGRDGNVTQGDVKFEGATNYGVQTGNIFGYNLIIGRINVVLASANNLTHKLQDFTASVEMFSQRLKSMGEKVGATANVMNTINELVVEQAKREGITDKDITKDAKLAQVKDKDWGAGKGNALESEVLSRKCFKNMMEAIRGTNRLFDDITKKIEDVSDTLIRPQVLGRGGQQSVPEMKGQDDKVTMDEADKKDMSLTEKDIEYMEMNIESRKTELNMMFIVFEFVINNEKQEQAEKRRNVVERIVADSWRLLKELADRLLRGESSPRSDFRGPDPLLPRNGLMPDMRLLQFPDLSRLTSLYMGWVVRKARLPDNPTVGLERSTKYSWAYAVLTRLTLSTEELFLKVLAQITQRERLGRTLQADCATVLKSTSQKLVVDRLLRDQNRGLQTFHPQLEWALAGLESQPSHITTVSGQGSGVKQKGRTKTDAVQNGKRETTTIEVILKTQWRAPWLGQLTHGPIGIGGSVPPGSLGPGLPNIGPPGGERRGGGGGIEFPVGYSGPAGLVGGGPTPVGGGGDGLWANAGIDERTPSRPNPEQRRSRPVLHTSGRSRSRLRLHSELKKHRPVIVVREPKFVFVKAGGKKKAEKNGKAKSKKKRQEKVYVELRRPGDYHQRSPSRDDDSPGPSTSFIPAPPLQPHPPQNHQLPPVFHQVPRPGANIRPGMSHIPPPIVRPPPPPPPPPPGGFRPPRVHVAPRQTERERQQEETEVIEEIFEEFEELSDKKGKKKSKRPGRVSDLAARRRARLEMKKKAARADEHQHYQQQQQDFGLAVDISSESDSDSDAGISRRLMRQVERRSQQRMSQEQKNIEKIKVDVMMGQNARHRPPPPPVVPISIQPRSHPPPPPRGPYMTPIPRGYADEIYLERSMPLGGRDRDRNEVGDNPHRRRYHQVQVEDVADYDDDNWSGENLEETQNYYAGGASSLDRRHYNHDISIERPVILSHDNRMGDHHHRHYGYHVDSGGGGPSNTARPDTEEED